MATTTVSGSTVTFSNSGAAANITKTGTEDGSLLFSFDVLAQSGGGTNTTVYSIDDGIKNDDGGATIVVANKAFADYNKDLLIKDTAAVVETSVKGASFWIGTDGKIYYDASALSAQINALGAGAQFTDTIQYTIKMSNGTLSVGTLTVIVKGAEDEATGTLGISGTVAEGSTISADTSGLSDVDGGIVNTTYQWQISDDGVTFTNIAGATTATLNIPGDQSYVGKHVQLTAVTTDGFGGTTAFTSASAQVANVNDAPTAVVLSNTVTSTPENGGSIKVADIAVTDVDSGANVLSLSGTDALSFTILGGALYFNGGANFEAKTSYDVTVDVNDGTVGGNPDASQSFHLNITNVNEAPTAVVFSNTVTSTPENGGSIKVADIAVTDDALGTNVLSLSGADASSFAITGGALYFNGGANYESKASYDVTVNVNDATVGVNPDASQPFHLNITDVVESDSNTINDYDLFDVNGNAQVTSSSSGNGHTFTGSSSGETIVATDDPVNGDTVNAQGGDDTVYGRGGDDDLKGQNANDTIYGGSGNDTIIGGGGADHLWGGSGNDTFEFTAASDSSSGAPDTIHDFHHGFDRINVTQINSGDGGVGDFAFGGTVATAHGVWYTEDLVDNNTTLHFDTNGSTGTDEMRIVLTGTGLGLTASDFLL
jgi:VCBS repeat-containing protein